MFKTLKFRIIYLMFSRSFYEKTLLMLIGSALTYYVALKLININDNQQSEYTGTLDLNNHEKMVHSNVIQPTAIHTEFKDIVGHTIAKNLLEKLVLRPLSIKKNPPNGLILYGPPGTGKTMLIKGLCKEMNVPFIVFEQSYIEQKMFGESAKMIKAVFTLAEKLKPCVIFIDELDGIFGERSTSDQSFITGIKTQMLTLMDGIISRDPSIIVIGATNRLNTIDPALRRRMRTHIEITLPESKDRESMFRHFLDYRENIDYAKLVDASIGFSGSDISEMCKIAQFMEDTITTNTVLDAIMNCS